MGFKVSVLLIPLLVTCSKDQVESAQSSLVLDETFGSQGALRQTDPVIFDQKSHQGVHFNSDDMSLIELFALPKRDVAPFLFRTDLGKFIVAVYPEELVQVPAGDVLPELTSPLAFMAHHSKNRQLVVIDQSSKAFIGQWDEAGALKGSVEGDLTLAEGENIVTTYLSDNQNWYVLTDLSGYVASLEEVLKTGRMDLTAFDKPAGDVRSMSKARKERTIWIGTQSRVTLIEEGEEQSLAQFEFEAEDVPYFWGLSEIGHVIFVREGQMKVLYSNDAGEFVQVDLYPPLTGTVLKSSLSSQSLVILEKREGARFVRHFALSDGGETFWEEVPSIGSVYLGATFYVIDHHRLLGHFEKVSLVNEKENVSLTGFNFSVLGQDSSD